MTLVCRDGRPGTSRRLHVKILILPTWCGSRDNRLQRIRRPGRPISQVRGYQQDKDRKADGPGRSDATCFCRAEVPLEASAAVGEQPDCA